MLAWDWDDAPDEFRKLSRHGGDEDFVMFFARGVIGTAIYDWMKEKIRNDWHDKDVHLVKGGFIVILAHA